VDRYLGMLQRGEAAKDAVARGLGLLSSHLRDVLRLPPELMRIDVASFPVMVRQDGQMSPPPPVSLHAEYASELFALAGFMQNADQDAHLAPLVRFNCREDGRNFDVFSTDIEMAYLVNRAGSGHLIEYPRGAYVFRPGARVKLNVSIDPAYVGSATQDKRWGVMLLFNLWRQK